MQWFDKYYVLANSATVLVILAGTYGKIDSMWTLTLGLVGLSLFMRGIRDAFE